MGAQREGTMVPGQVLDSKTGSGAAQSCEILAETHGWFVRTADGELIGPFAALREVEDWLDARDQHKPRSETKAE
jgi:hypothetical protein